MQDNIQFTREERLKMHAKSELYEIGIIAENLARNVLERQNSILNHPEFSAQEIFALFGSEATQKTIAFTRAVKTALEIYDPVKYPNIPADLSGINLS